MLHVEVIETNSLGNRGYLVHDGTVAIAVDVQRDYQRWIDAAHSLGVNITYVIETHMHNDYVTGGYQLSKKVKAQYIIPADAGASFKATECVDGQEFSVGAFKLRGLHTPGHTEHHMSYVVSDNQEQVIFTGGGVLYGTVGRPDLVSPSKTPKLANLQYDSAQRLGSELPDTAKIYPTHGFGSFCSSSPGTGATQSTLADEKSTNIAYTASSKKEFVDMILAGLGPYPTYYAHMGPLNRDGPPKVKQLRIKDMKSKELRRRIANNEWIIDIRDRKAYAAHHPSGSLGIELGGSFATYVGWLIPWGSVITLVGDNTQHLQDAYTELSRIGFDQHVAAASADVYEYQQAGMGHTFDVVTFADLKRLRASGKKPYVLDVRMESEAQDGTVDGAVHIPLHELPSRIQDIPDDRQIWTHCQSGYRASIAASFLDKHGKLPVLLNDAFEAAQKIGLVGADT